MNDINSTYSKHFADFGFNNAVYVATAKGVRIKLNDGRELLDCGMALGSVGLGYANERVDAAVSDSLKHGVSFSLPSTYEARTAASLHTLFPGYSSIKFAKSSSILAGAVARLTRHASKRDLIAFPMGAYLGNVDWYLAGSSFHGGIPKSIRTLSRTFEEGSEEALVNLFNECGEEIACIYLEPFRQKPHPAEYYELLFQLAERYGVYIVFDETLSVFRFAYPSASARLGLKPDILVVGKSIANGFALNAALIGPTLAAHVTQPPHMNGDLYAFSNTHAGENLGLAAALSTIAIYNEAPVIERIHATGRSVRDVMYSSLEEAGIEDLQVSGNDGYVVLKGNSEKGQRMRSELCQQLSVHGILYRGVFSPALAHTSNDIDMFATAFRNTVKRL